MKTISNYYRHAGFIAIAGLLALIVGLIVILLLPNISYIAWGLLTLGVLLMAIALLLDYKRVNHSLTGKRMRLSAGTTVITLIFIGIIILANAISIGNYRRFDVTALGQFTLTEQTKNVLRYMENPVEVQFFYGVSSEIDIMIRSYVESILREYQNYTDKLSVNFIDTDEQPEQARKYDIRAYSTAVFTSENRQRVVLPYEILVPGEQDFALEAEYAFTSAILEVTGIAQKKIYFLTGHGEGNINSTASVGYSSAKQGLQDNLFQVGTLDLLLDPVIPQDMSALVIAGSQEELTSVEMDTIRHYIEDGGWVMILLNPDPPQSLRHLLETWGIKIEDGTVVDTSSYVAPNKDYPSIPRTRAFFNLPITYFPGATAIIPQEEIAKTVEMQPLVWTSKESWLETDFEKQNEPVFTKGSDVEGPLALGVLITSTLPEELDDQSDFRDTRIIIFGDSDFASNKHFYDGNNGDLFLNALNLLTTGEELISIEQKVLPFRRLIVDPEEAQFINYSSISLLPLIVLVIGGIIWWQRR